MTMSNVEDNSDPITLNTGQRLALNLDSHIVIDAGAGTVSYTHLTLPTTPYV